jgi:serine protease DegQ
VLRGGPADRAGVMPGDRLTAINGVPVSDPQAMLNLVAALAPGSSAAMQVQRKAQTLELVVTVGRRPKPQAQE